MPAPCRELQGPSKFCSALYSTISEAFQLRHSLYCRLAPIYMDCPEADMVQAMVSTRAATPALQIPCNLSSTALSSQASASASTALST